MTKLREGLGMLAITVFVIAGCGSSSPSDEAQIHDVLVRWQNAIRDNDGAGVCRDYVKNIRDSYSCGDAYVKQAEGLQAMAQKQDLTPKAIFNGHATVFLARAAVTIHLSKSSGDWKITCLC